MVRVFPKSANQPNEIALTICNSIFRNCFRLMRDWKLENLANGEEITVVFRSERKKRNTSRGGLQFPTGFFTKIPCNLTFNRNFQIFLINGEHPYFSKNPFGNCRLPPEVILSSWFNSLIMEVYCKRAQFLSMPRSLANASYSSAFRRLVLPYSDFILTHPVKRTPRLWEHSNTVDLSHTSEKFWCLWNMCSISWKTLSWSYKEIFRLLLCLSC